ncbi:MAG TPA: methyltransferase, TIGR04325 family [Myxococcales bacterium]|nr:methyltransferase, TIGR04325 family [Myxococcales bacterium]
MIRSLIRKLRRRRFFARGAGNFYAGVYGSFEEARRSIPARQTQGYDNETAAGFYRERLEQVFPADYASLFWLKPLVRDSVRIFDFGGHVGLHYYSWRRLLELPPSARWVVADVPAVCAAGAKLAQERGAAEQLSFTGGGLKACAGADVFLSAGALQYLEPDALPQALSSAERPPGHLVINKIPVVNGDGYFTVQDTGVFNAPYSIFSRPRLVEALKAQRYELVDAWENPGLHCDITDAPAKSVQAYSGFYFRRA